MLDVVSDHVVSLYSPLVGRCIGGSGVTVQERVCVRKDGDAGG